MEYVRLCKTKKDKGKLIPKDDFYKDPYKYINDTSVDWYVSLFYYNEEHAEQFKKKKTVSGIKDVTTDKLVFDFDNETNIDVAYNDALEFANRLIDRNVHPDSVQIYFSGNKGFSVELTSKNKFNPTQMKELASELGKDLSTLDLQIYNASRVMRFPGTKHDVSGLYKTALMDEDLDKSVDEIKKLAATYRPFTMLNPTDLSPKIEKEEYRADDSIPELDINFSNKPRGWHDAKYALLNGLIPNGIGHNAFLCLASTMRSLGYPRTVTEGALYGTNRLRVQRGFEEHEVDDIQLILDNVYSEDWNGGTFSIKEPGWLRDYAVKYGFLKDEEPEEDVISTADVFNIFKSYAKDFKNNIIPTGIKTLDEQAKFLVGTSNAILASPSVGKSTFAIGILNNTSRQNLSSIFFSYDMYHSLIFTRLIQRHFGLRQDDIFRMVEDNDISVNRWLEKLKEEYNKVRFCFKSGQTTGDIERTIIDTQQRTGEKIKLVLIDYNELIISPMSDPTSASAQVAQELRRIANDHAVCVITLLQPAKLYADPSEEFSNYSAAKGSSAIAQSVTLMFGMSRPGWDSRYPENDKFVTIKCLKNRMGGLFALDYKFDGLTGRITEMNEEDEVLLADIRAAKENNKKDDDGWGK